MKALSLIKEQRGGGPKQTLLICIETSEIRSLSDWAREIAAVRGTSFNGTKVTLSRAMKMGGAYLGLTFKKVESYNG